LSCGRFAPSLLSRIHGVLFETMAAARVKPTMRVSDETRVGSNAKVLRPLMETEAPLVVRTEGVGCEPTRVFARRFSIWPRRSAPGCVEPRLASLSRVWLR
jgi:hypothetical protein